MTPVQTPAHPAAAIKINGTLQRDAEVRHTPGSNSHALLVAELHTGRGLPYQVLQDLGTSPAAHLAAESKARLLRRGALCTVWAKGAMPQTDHDRAVLRLVEVTDLIPHDIPTDSAAR